MNGIHDMGGMHGLGPIGHDPDEPIFHHEWEGRVWALSRAIGPYGRGVWRNFRYELEQIPPADYLRMPYYERWFTVIVNRLLRSRFVTPGELATGKVDPSVPRPQVPPASPPEPGAIPGASRLNLPVRPRYRTGQQVRARNMHPEGHTRQPRYVRGKRGVVTVDHGVWALQDTTAAGDRVGGPQHVYTVRFAARELWGPPASPRDSVYVDLWEDHLERV
ncbi:MAG: nitrile hydratase subunit beta [Acidimicrobiia bacterium]|nr:nitrile hydratase subunit beta [Acidimicrobiia bacterium]